ncbi:ferredoxin [bacterium]|nr:MAG: ferredoxin [bacterium]
MKQHTVIKVWVDTDVCLAHYLCVHEAPRVFEEREGAVSVHIKPEADTQLLRDESENLFWAAAICPVSAIKLKLDTGEVIDGDSEIIKQFIACQRRT